MTGRPEPVRSRSGAGRLAGRASFNLVDQMLSAVTNVLLAVVVARAGDAAEFGAFSVAFLVFTMLIGLERAAAGDPLGIRFSAVTGTERRTVFGFAIGAVLGTSVLAAVPVAVCGLLLGGSLGAALLALAVVLPGLLLQDLCRMAFFAEGRPQLAVLDDVVWGVLELAVMVALVAGGVGHAWVFVLVWGGAATVAALLGLACLAVGPVVRGVVGWVRAQRDLSGYLLLEFLLGAGSAQTGVLLVGVIGSVDDVGAFRGAQILLGPLGVLAMAVSTFGRPEISRRATLDAARRSRIAVVVSAGMGAVSAVYAGLLLLVPDGVGTALFGDTWAGSATVLLPLAVSAVLAGCGLGPGLMLYAMGRANRTFRLRAVEAPLLVGAIAVGLLVAGRVGAAWGMAATMAVMVPLWFCVLSRVLRDVPPTTPEVTRG